MEQQKHGENGASIEIDVINGALAEYAAVGNGTGDGEVLVLDREAEELGFRILGYVPYVHFDGNVPPSSWVV